MAIQLLNLRHVPEDEADEVRALLERHGIGWYETEPNRWGISAGAFWLRDDEQAAEARRLLEDYQAERGRRARAEHEQAVAAGTAETLRARLRRHPVASAIYILVAAGLVYLAVRPFFGIAG